MFGIIRLGPSNGPRLFQIRATVRAVGAILAMTVAWPAAAQEGDAVDEIVVKGFRQSLGAALDVKRASDGSVDAIFAEDIADFPDLNLAESIQRVPGVSIARDAGEGRQITVRGLGPQFTRVRINGMEAMSANGGTDAAGGTNRDRSFDFNTFASELFNSITIRKTSAAETEEGSLGATVDLRSGRPFDYDGLTIAASAQSAYNDISEDFDPRVAFLISDTFADDKLGALLSVAYTERQLLDEGASTVRWQNSLNTDGTASAAAAFGPLDPGYTGPATLPQLNAAFRPRIPRYDIYEHDQERLGVTGSLQWKPGDNTSISLDTMYAKFDAERSEIFLESPVFSTNGAAGINNVNIRNAVIDSTNTIVFGLFDDVDIRSEARFDELSTEFTHITLDGEHSFSDAFKLHGLIGHSDAEHDNPVQTTLLFDRADVDGYSYDYRQDPRLPLITYANIDVTSPATWALSQVRLRPQSSENTFDTVQFDVAWNVTDKIALKAGPQYKKYELATTSLQRSNGSQTNQEAVIPANVAATPLASYSKIAEMSGHLDQPAGSVTRWLIPNLDQAASLFNLYNPAVWRVGIETALGNNYAIEEEDTGAYVQADLHADLGNMTLRGNLGVRYVETKQTSSGYTFTAGAPLLTTVERSYNDTLPALNVALEVTDSIILRAAIAKVMARPNGGGQTTGLGILAPGAAVTITGSNKTVTAGNPEIDPYRADSYDLGFEWYFADDALLSVALFQKEVESFVQIQRYTDNFANNTLGLPNSVALAVCGAAVPAATCLSDWQFSTPVNTDGGDVKGYEISYQQPFSFLSGPFRHFGLILNYTSVESEITYLSPPVVGLPQQSVKDDLTGLSESAYNATLYWENEMLSTRVSAAYRDEYLTTVPGRNNNNVEGTAETLSIDASVSWSVTDSLDLTLEALNLTDEFQDQWVDSNGDRLSYYHHQGRQYMLGARYRF